MVRSSIRASTTIWRCRCRRPCRACWPTADLSHILYEPTGGGVPAAVVSQATRVLDEFTALGDGVHQAINRGNALDLLPGLASRLNAAPAPAPAR